MSTVPQDRAEQTPLKLLANFLLTALAGIRSILTLDCSGCLIIGRMPGTQAALGDVYEVYRNVTEKPWTFGEKKKRPCGCVAPGPFDSTTWTALPRLSTDVQQDDLPSPAMPEIGLDKEGAWSLRWIHQVHKNKTGGGACAFLGSLPESERDRMLTFYRNRHNDPHGRGRSA